MKRVFPTPLFKATMIFLILVVGFVTLQPKVATEVWPARRMRLFDEFVEQVKSSNSFDPLAYWQFREFYSPGVTEFNPEIVGFGEIYTLNNFPHVSQTFLHYDSPRIQSWDIVFSNRSAVRAWQHPVYTEATSSADLVYFDGDTVMFYESPDLLHIIWTKPASDMEDVVGFFGYEKKEKELLMNKWWVHEALIGYDPI